ncbi:MAG: YicC/YloC family endoribonuclease [Pseudomonadota bacterium]
MTIQSMTGFARTNGQAGGEAWVWELRSLNGKGCDVRLRLPPGLEDIDIAARKQVAKRFVRGNLQVSLQFVSQATDLEPKVNEELALGLAEAAKSLQAKLGGALPDVAQIMNMRGVIELEEPALEETRRDQRNAQLLGSLDEALDQLESARVAEGADILKVLLAQLKTLRDLTGKIDRNEDRSPAAIKTTLANQIARLTSAEETLDPQRLHQEAVLIAAKADIQEELDRLEVHFASAGQLLAGEGPVGRKLDFLAQEFNRECNTICSKSNSASVTALGLDMKLVIDQFREQVQNME